MSEGIGARKNLFVAIVSFVASALVVSAAFPTLDLWFVLDMIAFIATNEVTWPLFWGFVVVAGVAVIRDW